MAERAGPGFGGLLARFDSVLLRPPALPDDDGQALAAATHQAPGPALLDWCHAGPAFASAELAGPGAPALAQALALHLDGSLRLQACPGGAGRLALRLRVKCDDLMLALGRAPRRSDCWDSGWLVGDAAAAARLPLWQPRRATLVLAQHRDAAARAGVQAALGARHLRRPVRLLWVGEGPAPLAWRALR